MKNLFKWGSHEIPRTVTFIGIFLKFNLKDNSLWGQSIFWTFLIYCLFWLKLQSVVKFALYLIHIEGNLYSLQRKYRRYFYVELEHLYWSSRAEISFYIFSQEQNLRKCQKNKHFKKCFSTYFKHLLFLLFAGFWLWKLYKKKSKQTIVFGMFLHFFFGGGVKIFRSLVKASFNRIQFWSEGSFWLKVY